MRSDGHASVNILLTQYKLSVSQCELQLSMVWVTSTVAGRFIIQAEKA